jgi:hypothetical protein
MIGSGRAGAALELVDHHYGDSEQDSAITIAERWVGTVRRELLDRILIVNRRHLTAVLTQYVAHFNHHRPHRALQQAAPLRSLPLPAAPSQSHIRRRDLLDGLIHEYTQVAWRGWPVRHPQHSYKVVVVALFR